MLGRGAVLFGLIDLLIFNYPVLTTSLIPEVILYILMGLPEWLSCVCFLSHSNGEASVRWHNSMTNRSKSESTVVL
jgi:hypothetical protein